MVTQTVLDYISDCTSSLVTVIILLPTECRAWACVSILEPSYILKNPTLFVEKPTIFHRHLPECMWTSHAQQSEDASMQQRADL